jgi:hypothetical protein
MKQLFNEINGRTLDLSFTDDSSDRQIYLWVKQQIMFRDETNFEELRLNEIHSCKVSFNSYERIIEIRGDEDLVFIKIKDLQLINLN